MAKFSKRPKTGKPRTQPCTGHVYTAEESKAYILRHFFGAPPADSDRDVFSVILGRPMSAREFDTAKQLGLVE
jgi:hypothetical protein